MSDAKNHADGDLPAVHRQAWLRLLEHPDAHREPRGDALRAVTALALLGLLLFPLGTDAVWGRGAWRNTAALVHAKGHFVPVVEAQDRNRMFNVSLGLATRWSARGTPQRLLLPRPLDQLADLPLDLFDGKVRTTMQRNLVRLMSGPSIESWTFDPDLPTDQFDDLLASGTTREFPFRIYGLRLPKLTGKRLIAVRDAGSDRIAVIPLAVSPIDTCEQDYDDECPDPAFEDSDDVRD